VSSKDRGEVRYDILSYLLEHPDAQDTLEGIVEWWLLERRIEDQTLKVKETLAQLIAEGFIVEQHGKDLRARYRINRESLEKIESLLRNRAE
jgi:hypothetical protein